MRQTRMLSAAFLLVAGCLDLGGGEVPPGSPAQGFHERIAAGPTLGLDTPGSSLTVGGRYRGEQGWLAIDVRAGSIYFGIDDRDALVLESLDLRLDDVTVTPNDTPIRLTRIRLSAEPLAGRPTWSGVEPGEAPAVETTSLLRLELEWALMGGDGVVVPLAPQRLTPIPAWLRVTEVDGHLLAELDAASPDVLWSWAGIVEIAGVRMDLAAGDDDPLPVD